MPRLGDLLEVRGARTFATKKTIEVERIVEYRTNSGAIGLGIVKERKRSLRRSKTKKYVLTIREENGVLTSIPERNVTYKVCDAATQFTKAKSEIEGRIKDEEKETVLLRSIKEKARNLMESIRPGTLAAMWERRSAKNRQRSFALEDLTRKLFHSNDAIELYATHKLLEADTVRFRRKGLLWSFRSKKKVAEKSEQALEMAEEDALEDRFLCRLRRHMIRKLQSDPSPEFPIPPLPPSLEDCWQALEEEEDWEFDTQELKSLATLKKEVALQLSIQPEYEGFSARVAKEILPSETPDKPDALEILAGKKSKDHAYLLKLLVRLGFLKDADDLDTIQSPVSLSFTHAEEKAALKLSEDPPKDLETRVKLEDLVVVSVDPEDTLERDDAFSIAEKDGHNWILVHIADATRWIEMDSILDQAAKRKGSAVYLAGGRKLNMLPASLSREQIALSPARENHALTFAIRLNEDGSLAEYQIFPSLIPPVTVLTYTQLDSILRDASHPDHQAPHFAQLHELAKQRQQYRISKGAQFLDLSDVEHRKVDTSSLATGGRPPKGSKMMVNEFLLLAGEAAALFAQRNDVPFLFRAQAPPRDSQGYFSYLMRPSLSDSELVRIHKLRNMTQPQDVTRECKHHFSLALKAYAQVNAPLRRYADLLLHYQLKAILQGGRPPLQDFQLQRRLLDLKETLKAVNALEEATQRRALVRYFEETKDQSHLAVVVDLHPVIAGGTMIADSRATVVFPHLPEPRNQWTYAMDVPKHVKVGSSIRLRINRADSLTNRLEFNLDV